jgi:hypothetical protein
MLLLRGQRGREGASERARGHEAERQSETRRTERGRRVDGHKVSFVRSFSSVPLGHLEQGHHQNPNLSPQCFKFKHVPSTYYYI